jgi:2,3-bisphosphoglycerate-dependent phosphoglycerate mutase
MAYLILVRHGKSEWNALGLWTGWKDISLSDEGRVEAKRAAQQLRDIKIHKAHTSSLARAKETLEIIQEELEIKDVPVSRHNEANSK